MAESKEVIHCIQDPVAENLSLPSCEVGPLGGLGLGFFLRHDAGDQGIAVAEFDGLAGAEPGFELLGVAQTGGCLPTAYHDCDT